jgi:hypothetical protein
LQRIDADLRISNDNNPEVKIGWYPLGIQFAFEPVFG